MSTAAAPVATAMRVPVRKWQREVQPGLEDLGFMFKGLDASAHAIFQHPSAGQVRLSGSPSGDTQELKRQALARARRLLVLQESEAQTFLHDLRELYGILPHEFKKIRLNLTDEITVWAKRVKPKMRVSQIRDYLRDSPFVETVDWQRGSRKQDYIIYGSKAQMVEITDQGVEIPAAVVDHARREWLKAVADGGGPITWLAEYLSQGARLVDDVKANNPSFAWSQIEKAKEVLGVLPDRESKYQGRMFWRLPAPKEIAEYDPKRDNGVQAAVAPAEPPPEPETVAEPLVREAVDAPPQTTTVASSLVDQITSMAENAARTEEAEAKVSLVLDEMRVLQTEVFAHVEAAKLLRDRINQAMSILTSEGTSSE